MSIEQIRQQAQDENTAPEILAELAKSKDYLIRQYVAANLSTPTETLLNLGVEFPDHIIANPIFDLLFLENPSSYFVKLSLVRSSTTSQQTLIRLADLENITIEEIEILYAIAYNQNTPIKVLDNLLNWQPNFYFYYGSGVNIHRVLDRIVYFVANNQNTPSYLLKKIASDRSREIHRRISNNQIYPKTLKKLRESINFKILRVIANNSNASNEILEYLAGENCPQLHQIILKNSNVSQKAIDIIKFRQQPHRRSSYLLEELAQDQRAEVRALVASYPKIPLSIVKSLVKDRNLLVSFAILQNPNVPTIILEELAKKSHKKIHKIILKHPNVSSKAKAIILLMRSHSPVKISNSILEELAKDEGVSVRKKIVQNELTPNYILRQLLNDSDQYIREKALKQLTAKKISIN